jgi:pilus assembly protein CpaB
MNTRAFTLSLVIAIIAMLMVHSYMEGQEKSFIEEYGQKVAVIVAKDDIKEFDIIDDRKVSTIQVPKNFKQPGAFSNVSELQNTIALVPILKGEQITSPRVSFPGSSTGLSRQVAPGKRAISIRISEDQAVGKLIKPGDRVDVLARIDYAGGRKDLQNVKTILQDVLVLSTGLSITNSLPLVGVQNNDEFRKLNLNTYTNYNNITLELDPYEAQKLIFLIYVAGGRPYLTLRNNNDKEQVRIRPTRLFDILGDEATEAKTFFQQRQGAN